MPHDSSDRHLSQQRLARARRDGTFPYSRLCTTAIVWLALGWGLTALAPAVVGESKRIVRELWSGPAWTAVGDATVVDHVQQVCRSLLLATGSALVAGCLLILGGGGLQTRFYLFPGRLLADDPVRPKWRLALGDFVLNTSLAAVVIVAAAIYVRHQFPMWLDLIGRSPDVQAIHAARYVGSACLAIGVSWLAWGVVELTWRRWRIRQQLRPTDEQWREEIRAIEGDVRTEQQRRRLSREISRPPVTHCADTRNARNSPPNVSGSGAGRRR